MEDWVDKDRVLDLEVAELVARTVDTVHAINSAIDDLNEIMNKVRNSPRSSLASHLSIRSA
jgi:hypothetical protein